MPTDPASAAHQRSPSWPENRRAPGRLELVRRLLNTTHLETGWELLGGRHEAARWLAGEGFAADGTLTERRAAVLRSFRERLRGSIEHPTSATGETTEWLFAPDRRVVQFVLVDDVPLLEGAGGDAVERYLTTLTLVVGEALRDGLWPRFRTCANARCRWAFYDNSRNASGRWCSMDVCGARNKVSAYRART